MKWGSHGGEIEVMWSEMGDTWRCFDVDDWLPSDVVKTARYSSKIRVKKIKC